MIRSMTGFVAKRILLSGSDEVVVNIRSLNFKYLDIHISKIPWGFEELEKVIYQEVIQKIKRGRLEIFIGINPEGSLKLSPKKVFRVKQVFTAALKELIEFKKMQGKAIKKEIKQITTSLRRRIQFFKTYLKKIELPKQDLTKDILEEVSLVSFYLKHLTKILNKEKDKLGKLLDFLSQELLRETNTILAKVKNKQLCLEAVYFKEEVDRLRELAQNIE